MTKIAYFQCPTGIAGDMCLGALVHAGVPLDYLEEKLALLGVSQEYQLHTESVHHHNQLATKVHVHLTHPHVHHHAEESDHPHQHHHHPSRHLPEIERMILQAGLPKRSEAWSLGIFRKLAEAEGAVHGISPENVHFHEVGAIDAIVDIVGTCLGLDWLGIDQLYCSPLPTGGGTIWAAHGRLPVPAPATLRLFEMGKVPVYSNGIEKELVTPTGAAIAVTLATEFGQPPAMSVQTVGLGAGSRQLPIPNILRLWVGETSEPVICDQETIAVLETQIDDLSPQAIAYTYNRLFEVGALDVFTQPITMKKSRLGVLLTVICHPESVLACQNVLFRETTTLGIRHSLQQRTILPREIQTIETKYGLVRVKVAFQGNTVINVQPEYEDCATLAKQHNVSWLEVHQTALQSWSSQF